MIINDLLNHIKQHQSLPSPVDLKLPYRKRKHNLIEILVLAKNSKQKRAKNC